MDATGIVWTRMREAWAAADSGVLPLPVLPSKRLRGEMRRTLDAWGSGPPAADRMVALVAWRFKSQHHRADWLRRGSYGLETLVGHALDYDRLRSTEASGGSSAPPLPERENIFDRLEREHLEAEARDAAHRTP